MRRSWRRMGGGCLAAATLLLIAACGGSSKSSPSPSGGVWRRHVDAPAGFIIDYPDAWDVYQPKDPGIQFLVGPNEQDFAEVHIFQNLPVSFSANDTQAMKQVVDASLSGQPINVISTSQITNNGLPGWQYVYAFNDPKFGAGVHVHVFLFQGNRLHTIVFQALPRSHFEKLAPTFQRMLNSYKALPLPSPSPGATPTATPSPSP